MTYTVTIERGAQKDIAALSSTDRTRVLAAIKKLADNPRPDGGRMSIRPKTAPGLIKINEFSMVFVR